MPLRSHLIIYNAREADIFSEMNKSRQQRRHRIRRTFRIDHQHNRDIQHSGYLIGRTFLAVIAVEKPHHPFHDTDICLFAILPEELPDMLRLSHKRIEVDAGTSADSLVELRVDIVRSALEGLHLVALLAQQRHQSSGNGCLARAARRSRYKKCLSCCHYHYFCCKIKKNPLIMHHLSEKVVSLHADNGNLVADAA